MSGNEIDLTSWTTDIVSAYVENNAISSENLPEFIGSVYAALSKACQHGGETPKEELKPAVSIKKSVTPEYIVCLEDGKTFKSLKRHLRTHYDLSPEEYRQKWGLPHDYPMVAPAYAAARSHLARTMGLGRRAADAAEAPKANASAPGAKTGKTRGRPAKAARK